MVIASPPSSAPSGGPRSGPRRGPREFGGGRKFTPRRKVCQFCVDKIQEVDYKDLGRLRRYLSERGKIEPRRKTGTCAAHQRSLNVALKRARQLAMLPFTAEHIRVTGVLVREPGAPPFRGPRGPRPVDGEATEHAAEPAKAERDRGEEIFRKIVVRDAIKETGEYTVNVKLHRDVTLAVPVTVTAEGGEAATPAEAAATAAPADAAADGAAPPPPASAPAGAEAAAAPTTADTPAASPATTEPD